MSYQAGKFTVPGTDIAPLTFGSVARMAYVGHKLPDGMEPGLDETVFYDPKGMGSPSGIHMAYVEVDPETGMSRFSITSPSTTPARSSIRCWPPARFTAAWCRASRRRCMKTSATILTPGN